MSYEERRDTRFVIRTVRLLAELELGDPIQALEELIVARAALTRIATHPKTRADELSAAGMREVARQAIGKRL